MPVTYTPTGRTRRGLTGHLYREWVVENSDGLMPRGSGLGFDWGPIIQAGTQAFSVWYAAQQLPRPPSLQEKLDQTWFQLRDWFTQLVAAAKADPTKAAQALNAAQGAAQAWASAKGEFMSLNTPQSGYQVDGVTNWVNKWLGELTALAGGGSGQPNSPAPNQPAGAGGGFSVGGFDIPLWALAGVAAIFLLKR